jgi:RNA methyltransferase, TrmH family
MNIITSKNNNLIISTAKLKSLKYRNIKKAFLIESKKVVDTALTSEYKIRTIFYQNDKYDNFKNTLDKAESINIEIFPVTSQVMEKLSFSKTPQGIIAVADMMESNLNDIKSSLIVACDTLSDPGNLGTIIRTADAVGAGAVILNKECVDIYNDKVIRASMGSLFNIDIVSVDNLTDALSKLQKQDYRVGCGHLNGTDFFDRQIDKKSILVIGNEANGVSVKVSRICDHKWKLPMIGKAESLNAAIAAGIMLYDMTRNN